MENQDNPHITVNGNNNPINMSGTQIINDPDLISSFLEIIKNQQEEISRLTNKVLDYQDQIVSLKAQLLCNNEIKK